MVGEDAGSREARHFIVRMVFVLREVALDHRQLEGAEYAHIRFAFEQELERLFDELFYRHAAAGTTARHLEVPKR